MDSAKFTEVAGRKPLCLSVLSIFQSSDRSEEKIAKISKESKFTVHNNDNMR